MNDRDPAVSLNVEVARKVFVSCVSGEFGSYRTWLKHHLEALPGPMFEVKVQEDFQQGGFTLLQRLADYIRECDLVIHFIGESCGALPGPEHERTLLRHLGKPDSEPLPGLSYTQWEYRLAREFGRKTFVYFATSEAPCDCDRPVVQSKDQANLQLAHRKHIEAAGDHYSPFSDLKNLMRLVFNDLGLQPEHKINNLPFKSLGSLFVGRSDFLEQIRTTLSQPQRHGQKRAAAITASATAASIHGLGGIGKTRAAIEYAHEHSDEYTALLFVTADSPQSLRANLAGLCGILKLAEKDVTELEVQVAAAIQWLQRHPGWLLILDNVDSEEAAKEVEGLLGRLSSAGHVLITSRIRGWSGAVDNLALDVLSVEDAASFLLLRTASRRRKSNDDQEQATKLAITLGQLALALEQAGAMIDENRYTFGQYAEAWQSRHDEVLKWFDERKMQYPMSVAVTWQTSFDQLSKPARSLLRRLAWLAPDPIPESLLDVPLAGVEGNARDALANLEAYSLATRSDDAPSFTVHRLVQDVTRCGFDSEVEHAALTAALKWLNDAFVGEPQDVRNWPVLEPLAPHALLCDQFADKAEISDPTSRLLNQLGVLLNAKAQYADAEPLMRRALAIDEQSYGKDHSKVATRLNNLAQLLKATNRLSEAEPLMRRALAIDEQSYGKDHPDVARDLNNLAGLVQATNRLAEAEPLMRRALAIDEQSYGKDHPRVATRLNNLAQLLQATNRLAEAEPLMRRALAIDEQSYGKDHPRVAIRLNNLAQLLKATNRLAEAEPLMRRALEIDEQSYGKDHPKVATRLNNLAQLLKATNRLAEAEPLMRRALAIDEQSYGKDHPIVAIRLNNLAQLLQATNRLAEAEPLMRRALEIDEQSYGKDHPRVAIRLNNLVGLLQATNRLAEAEPLMRRALGIDEQSYGKDHPDVARDLSNLAQLLQATNRLAEAEPLMRHALAIDEQSYGKDHPHVARDLNNLAGLLQATNRLAEAEPLMRRALAIDEQSYGKDHPDVAIDLNNLAQLLKATNRLAEAEPLMRRHLLIFVQFTRATGHPHPHLEAAANNYGRLLMEMGRQREETIAALREIAPELF